MITLSRIIPLFGFLAICSVANAAPWPTLTIHQDAGWFSEYGGGISTRTITLHNSTPGNVAATVYFSFSGSASRNFDYTCPASITFPANTTSITFTIFGINDYIYELTESVYVTIASGYSYYVGTKNFVLFSIYDYTPGPE
jgi:hypothetical protein